MAVSMSIYEKLGVIQQELNAPKTQYNSFGKYSYRSCEVILQAVKPLLAKTKTALILSDSITGFDGRFYIAAKATLIDQEGPMTIDVEAYAREDETKKGMDGSQITGAASSYARKYALNGLFAIDDNKDSDTTNDGRQAPLPDQSSAARQVTKEQQDRQLQQSRQAPSQRRQAPPPDVYPDPLEAEDGYYYCKDCGQVIAGKKLQNGQQLSPKEVAILGIQNCGDQLCYSCGAARMKARQQERKQ